MEPGMTQSEARAAVERIARECPAMVRTATVQDVIALMERAYLEGWIVGVGVQMLLGRDVVARRNVEAGR